VRSREAPTRPAGAPRHDEPMCHARRSSQARCPATPEPAQSAQLAHLSVEEPRTWAVSRVLWATRSIAEIQLALRRPVVPISAGSAIVLPNVSVEGLLT
jgi:hypothetical protein